MMRRPRYSSSASETFEGLVFLLSIVTVVFSLVDYFSQDETPIPVQSMIEAGEPGR
jgi:hypothetical protein